MPPNQRASNKKQFGVTLTKEEVAKIDEAAKRLGITRTEFIRLAAMNQLSKDNNTRKEQ